MASVTPVTIVNMVLSELGAARITSFQDGSKNAGLVNAFYDLALEQTLAYHPWNFAIKRVKDVPERSTKPAWGYKYAYTYPPTCLRILGIGRKGIESQMKWSAEVDELTDERVVLTDLQPPIDIRFIYKVTNTQVFSPNFVLAFVKVLKTHLSRPLTGRAEVKVESMKELDDFVKKSLSVDGLEGTPDEYTPSDLEQVR